MINVHEHFYDDDPNIGPPDVRTVLRGVNYFFLGNGLIQAAVQSAPHGEGTPLGLLIMDPEQLRKKREALTMDPVYGLASTGLEIRSGSGRSVPDAGGVEAAWMEKEGVPAVRGNWTSGDIEVEEVFYVPNPAEASLIREVRICNHGENQVSARVRTGVLRSIVEQLILLAPGEENCVWFEYSLDAAARQVSLSALAGAPQTRKAASYWDGLARLSFGHPLLDHDFSAARAQLPAAVSKTGRADGSIWQYNREWLRDQSVVATALTILGERTRAWTMFDRLLTNFVTDEGDTVDSSERRDPDEVELDQNGFLLQALLQYVRWTGDLSLIREKWTKIEAAAEFPLQAVFRHPASGLLMNRREFWERHRFHGIEPGIELVHQLFSSIGLSAAAELARGVGRSEKSPYWEAEADRLKKAMLKDRAFRMVDNRGFLKRRGLDGRVQETMSAWPECGLPAEVPLAAPGEHFLNPDSSAALPIALEFIPADSPPATLTMSSLERLWNQSWVGGGYGRYHFSSEADSAGAWPFPSLFVARASVETGDFENVRRILEWLNSIPGSIAGGWFEFYGKRISPPYPQVGIIPWTWAEMILLCVHHLLGLRPEEDGLRLRPRLLPGIERVKARFRVRDARVDLDLKVGPKPGGFAWTTNGEIMRRSDRDLVVRYPEKNLEIYGEYGSGLR